MHEMNTDDFPWCNNPTNGFSGFAVKNTNTNFVLAFNHVADYMRGLVGNPSTGTLYFLWCPSGSNDATGMFASSTQYLGFDDYADLTCTGGTGGDCNNRAPGTHDVQGTHTVSGYTGAGQSIKDFVTEHYNALKNLGSGSLNFIVGEYGIENTSNRCPNHRPDPCTGHASNTQKRRDWFLGDGDFNNEGVPDVFGAFSGRIRSLGYFNLDMSHLNHADWRIGTGADDAYSDLANAHQTRLNIP
jgi:hypothetical protein